MLKIFTTQLTGYLKRYEGKEEFEDAARILAQASISNSTIWIYGTNEMNGVISEALFGQEPLENAKQLLPSNIDEVNDSDRVMIFSRFANDDEAIKIAKKLHEDMIPVIVVTTIADDHAENSLVNYADLVFDMKLKKGILPSDTGDRFLYPSSILALYIYFGITLTVKDILSEYE